MSQQVPQTRGAWASDRLSYLVWRYAPLAILLIFVGLITRGALLESEPVLRLALFRRVALLLAMLGFWALWSLLYVATVIVVEGEEGIRVRRGGSEVSYPWQMLQSLGTLKLKTTRFWWLRVQDERSVLFCTDAPVVGPEPEPRLIQEIRRHLAETER